MTTTEVSTRARGKIPKFNWVPAAFLLSLPLSAALGWLLFLLAGA